MDKEFWEKAYKTELKSGVWLILLGFAASILIISITIIQFFKNTYMENALNIIIVIFSVYNLVSFIIKYLAFREDFKKTLKDLDQLEKFRELNN